jgi:predicted ArsR family transcriptional regulator
MRPTAPAPVGRSCCINGPFREAAEQHADVVCSVHLGLMRGLLSELDAPLEARRLHSFVEPRCA